MDDRCQSESSRDRDDHNHNISGSGVSADGTPPPRRRIAQSVRFYLRYLRYHWRGMILYAIFCVIFAVVFALYHLPLGAVLYPALLCGALGFAAFWYDSRRIWHRHLQFERLQASLETITEAVRAQEASGWRSDWRTDGAPGPFPAADNQAEADYQELLRLLAGELERQTALLNRRYDDMTDYYTVWAHQIKTPIASIRLNMQNEDSDFARLVGEDLQRIEQYVEMVMAFLRLDSDSTDYVFRPCDLDEIIRQAVRKFAPQFIRRNLRLTYTPAEITVVTDEKWLCFVVEQILSNSLKYTRTGGIEIFLEAPKTLCIRDSGIGIAPEDLPRIFEKGYTGYNGRADKKASGLGLYLCRRSCENLGHSISAQSEPGKGTAIFIDLSQKNVRPE